MMSPAIYSLHCAATAMSEDRLIAILKKEIQDAGLLDMGHDVTPEKT